MTYSKPDGIVIIASSGCCCPPGQRHRGQHTNATTNWWRVARDAGDSVWHKIRNQSSALRLAEESKTCDEFVEAIQEKQ